MWIAGSISSFAPSGDNHQRPALEAERASYREQAELLAEAGADLLVLEMILGHRSGPDHRRSGSGHGSSGLGWIHPPSRQGWPDGSAPRARYRAATRGVHGACACGRPVLGRCRHAQRHRGNTTARSTPCSVPGAGRWLAILIAANGRSPNWRFGDLTPAAFVTAAESWVARGVQIVGGCCGIGPEHIKLVAERLHGRRVDRRAIHKPAH